MKKILSIIALALAFTLADNFSDNPENNPVADPVEHCSKCEDTGCIYEQINAEVIGEGSDTDIHNAVSKVVQLRGITDSVTIKNILAEYYL